LTALGNEAKENVMTQYPERTPEAKGPVPRAGFAGFLSAVWSRKWLIVLGAAVGLAVGGCLYVITPPLYQSTAQVLVIKKRPGHEMPLPFAEDQSLMHEAIMKSPLIVGRALKKRQLGSLQSFAGLADPTRVIVRSLSITPLDPRDSGRGSGIVLFLSFRGPVAEEGGTVLNAVVESYEAFLKETYKSVSDRSLELIEQARRLVREDLAKTQADYQKFREEAPLLWREGRNGPNILQERLSTIETKRAALLVQRTEIEGHLATIRTALEPARTFDELIAAVSQLSASVATERSRSGPSSLVEAQVLPLLLEEERLLEHYGRNHPDVRTVRRKIELGRDLAARPSAAWTSITALVGTDDNARQERVKELQMESLRRALRDLEGLKRHELNDVQKLEEALAELFKHEHDEAKKLINDEMRDAEYRSTMTRTEQLYDGIVRRLYDSNLTNDTGGFEAQILSPAGPGEQVQPNARNLFVLGGFLGALAGAGLAFLAGSLDKSLRSPEEIRSRLGLPVVGHIPLQPANPALWRRSEPASAALDRIVQTHSGHRSREGEAYRGLRTALFRGTQRRGQKVIQITSPGRGDGKTTLAANLAVCIAQSGKRVLLIDADLRQPRLHEIFGVSAEVGLTTVLTGECAPASAIQRSRVSGVEILPSGPLSAHPAELLASYRLKPLLTSVREQYDFVLVDTPALLAVTDASTVGDCVDAVVLVIHPFKNCRPGAERAKEILETLEPSILGVVVNKVGKRAGFGAGVQYSYEANGWDDGCESAYDHCQGKETYKTMREPPLAQAKDNA
jgi:capsular exopolysaccharide synthesis family protein